MIADLQLVTSVFFGSKKRLVCAAIDFAAVSSGKIIVRPAENVSCQSGLYSVVVTPANVHDSQILRDLLHGDETQVWGDSAYAGQSEALKQTAPDVQDFTHKKGSRSRHLTDEEKSSNRTKSRIRSKVEHIFGVMKCQFGFKKVR